MVEAAFKRRKTRIRRHRSVLYIRTGSGREVVVLLETERELSDTDRSLVEIFCSRLSVAFDNVILYQQLQDANTQLEDRVAQRTRALMPPTAGCPRNGCGCSAPTASRTRFSAPSRTI